MARISTYYGWNRFFGTLSAIQLGLKNFVDLIDAKFYARGYINIPFTIPATELAAGTPIELVSPVAGSIFRLQLNVQTDIVTGGDVTVKVGTTDVLGLVGTVANGATKGTVINDLSTRTDTTDDVNINSRIQIVPSAAFNGGGALAGMLTIQIT